MPTDATARKLVEQYVPSWAKLGVARREQEDGKPLAVIYLPWDPGIHSANRTRGRHWIARVLAGETEDAANAALWGYRAAGEPKFTQPVDVETLVFRQREMDDDNLLSGLKHCRDALVRLELLPGDESRWWRNAGLFLHCHKEYRPVWTVLILRARKETP